MTRSLQLSVLAILALLTLVAGGCSQDITGNTVRKHMSPEVQTMALSKDQRKNEHARAMNIDMRELGDDLDHLFMLDAPSRLSKYPVP